MTNQEKLRILVIDDEVTQRMLVKEYLEEAGHVVRQSDDGKHGLKMAISTKPDVILLDLLLPSIDGYSLCKSLKQRPETAETPIILITASREADVIEKGLAAGADDFLTKPVDWAFLADRVWNVVRKSRERIGMERLIQSRHAKTAPSEPRVSEIVVADRSRLEAEQNEILNRAVELVRSECTAELASLQSQHGEELRSLRERHGLEIESIRVSAQHNLLVAEHQYAGEMENLRSTYEAMIGEADQRIEEVRAATLAECAEGAKAAWSLAYRWACAQSAQASAILAKIRSAVQVNPSQRDLLDTELAAKALNNSFGKFKLAAQSLSSNSEVDQSPVSLASVAADVVAQVDALARERKIHFVFAASDTALRIMADENRLRYGLLSLLANAIRYTPAGGTVEFKYGCDRNGDVRVEIYDTGVGIAPAKLQELRLCLDVPVRPNVADPAEGAGLGIPVAMALSRQMGGELEFDSQLGVGTRACMVFPSSKRILFDQQLKAAG